MRGAYIHQPRFGDKHALQYDGVGLLNERTALRQAVQRSQQVWPPLGWRRPLHLGDGGAVASKLLTKALQAHVDDARQS